MSTDFILGMIVGGLTYIFAHIVVILALNRKERRDEQQRKITTTN